MIHEVYSPARIRRLGFGLDEVMVGYLRAEGLLPWITLQRFLRELPEGLAGGSASSGKSSGQTSQLERWNCTLRQRLGRFVRKTLSFSKSEAMHKICLVLFLHDCNCLCLKNTKWVTTTYGH